MLHRTIRALIIGALLSSPCRLAANPVPMNWSHSFGQNNNETLSRVIKTADGGFILAGKSNHVSGYTSTLHVAKLNRQRSLDWSLDLRGEQSNECTGLIELADVGFIISGISHPNWTSERSGFMIRLSENGEQIWEREIFPGAYWNDLQVFPAPDNRIIALIDTGQSVQYSLFDESGSLISEVVSNAISSRFKAAIDYTGQPVILFRNHASASSRLIRLNLANDRFTEQLLFDYGVLSARYLFATADSGFLTLSSSNNTGVTQIVKISNRNRIEWRDTLRLEMDNFEPKLIEIDDRLLLTQAKRNSIWVVELSTEGELLSTSEIPTGDAASDVMEICAAWVSGDRSYDLFVTICDRVNSYEAPMNGDFGLIQLDANLDPISISRFGQPGGSYSFTTGVTPFRDGYAFSYYTDENPDFTPRVGLILYDGFGDSLLSRLYMIPELPAGNMWHNDYGPKGYGIISDGQEGYMLFGPAGRDSSARIWVLHLSYDGDSLGTFDFPVGPLGHGDLPIKMLTLPEGDFILSFGHKERFDENSTITDGRLIKFNQNGQILAEYESERFDPVDLKQVEDGSIMIPLRWGGTIFRFSTNLNLLESIRLNNGGFAWGAEIEGFFADEDAFIYISGETHDVACRCSNIYKFDPAGNMIWVLDHISGSGTVHPYSDSHLVFLNWGTSFTFIDKQTGAESESDWLMNFGMINQLYPVGDKYLVAGERNLNAACGMVEFERLTVPSDVLPHPDDFFLSPPFPSPFNSSTTISFSLPPGFGEAGLRVYDLSGRLVKELVNSRVEAGEHKVEWEAKGLGSGVYVVRLEGAGKTVSQKIVLMR